MKERSADSSKTDCTSQYNPKTRMQHYNSYSDLVQRAVEAEEIEKAFNSHRQDKGKKKLSFSSAKSWF